MSGFPCPVDLSLRPDGYVPENRCLDLRPPQTRPTLSRPALIARDCKESKLSVCLSISNRLGLRLGVRRGKLELANVVNICTWADIFPTHRTYEPQ